MTIPVSAVAGAKSYLLTTITSQVNDATVLVCYDGPGPSQPPDIISVGDVMRTVDTFQMVGSGGAGWLDETFIVMVTVSVFRGGDDAKTVFERACTLGYAVETVVRSDPTLGGAVTQAHPSVAEYVASWEAEHKGRVAEIILHITCRHPI